MTAECAAKAVPEWDERALLTRELPSAAAELCRFLAAPLTVTQHRVHRLGIGTHFRPPSAEVQLEEVDVLSTVL